MESALRELVESFERFLEKRPEQIDRMENREDILGFEAFKTLQKAEDKYILDTFRTMKRKANEMYGASIP